jgi:hypothetical protein
LLSLFLVRTLQYFLNIFLIFLPIKTLKNHPQNLLIIHNWFFPLLPWAAHMAQNCKFMSKIGLRHPLLYQFCTCDSSSHESFFTLREIEFLGHCNRDKSVPVPPESQKYMLIKVQKRFTHVTRGKSFQEAMFYIIIFS